MRTSEHISMQQILFQIHIARSQEKITVLLGWLVSVTDQQTAGSQMTLMR